MRPLADCSWHMETYRRRKYRENKETISVNETQYSKDREQSRLMGTVAPPLARHGSAVLPRHPFSGCGPQAPDVTNPHRESVVLYDIYADIDHGIQKVAVGSLFEIDHIHLPPRTPGQLRSIRVAMVSEKTQLNIAVRFPSMESLETYFRNSATEMYPQLDEKFVMGISLASKVLSRQVPSHEFAEKKHLMGFWLVNTTVGGIDGNCSKKGTLMSALKCNGMVRWGARRQVKFLERHKENPLHFNDLSSNDHFSMDLVKTNEEDIVEDSEGQEEDDNNEEDEKEENEEEEDDEEETETDDVDIKDVKVVPEETDGNFRRKRYMLRQNSSRKKAKIIKRENQKQKKRQAPAGRNRCRDLVVYENPKDRWSAERYNLATKNLLEVMKAKGATASNPIIRPDLRAEARKRIGDTGLLDHLLKHMAGKLAPGGEHRFRRRHNADGAMEYWLESADLVDIRKQAGVTDPFWIPPPGWKPGDSPTQDPVCAKELRLLKNEIFELKRKSRDAVPKKLFNEEITKLRREIEKLASSKNQMEKEVSSDPTSIGQKLEQLANSLVSSKAHLAKAPDSLGTYEQQLMVILDLAKGIEQEMKKLLPNPKAQGETRPDSTFIGSTRSGAEKETKQWKAEQKSKEKKTEHVAINEGEESTAKHGVKTATTAPGSEIAEEKAAKIQRLRSGFRICKPQGTFLWPSMVKPGPPQSQVVVQVEDLLLVPTPPSVTSSTALAPPQLPSSHHSTSPVKPLAERRAVTVTVSTLTNGHGHQNFSTTTTTTTTTTASTSPPKQGFPLNLNDVPSIHPNEGFRGKPPTQQTISTSEMNRLLPDKGKEAKGHSEQKQSNCCSSSASCLSSGVRDWLALATANSVSDDSSQNSLVQRS